MKYIKYNRGLWGKYYKGVRDVRIFRSVTVCRICKMLYIKYNRGLWRKYHEGMKDVRVFMGNLGVQQYIEYTKICKIY